MLRAGTRTKIAIVLAAIAQLATAVAGVSGGSAWPAVLLSAAITAVAVGRHVGYWLGLATAIAVSLVLVLSVLSVTPGLGVSMLAALAISAATVGAGALVSIGRSEARGAQPVTMIRALPALAGSVGGVLVFGALAVGSRLADNVRLDWVMRADSANNLIFAGDMIARNGIAIGGDENPAPLSQALVALTAAPGREAVSAGSLVAHDLTAMALTWTALIAVSCLLSGLVAAAVVRRAGGSWKFVSFAALGGSLIVLSWFFTGYPIQYGFLNAHVALIVLLVAVLAYFSASRAPWLGLSVILASTILILAVWSPLVVIPGALTVAFLISHWSGLRSARGARLALPLVAAVSLIAYGLAVTLPGLLAQGEALTEPGAVFNPGNNSVFVIGGGVAALAVLVFRSLRAPEPLAVIALVVAAWAGFGVLLYASRNLVDPFSYYPLKFAWMAELVFFILAVGLVVAFASGQKARSLPRMATIGVTVAVIAVMVATVPAWGQKGDAQHPLGYLAVGEEAGSYATLADYILDFTGDEAPAVLWRSGFHREGPANVWIMQANAGELDSELRKLGFLSYVHPEATYLCRYAEITGPGLTVHTQDAGLEEELDVACPENAAVFIVEPPRTSAK